MSGKTVFVTGATGYIGRALIPRLLARGHRVLALTRAGSTDRVPAGAEVVTGSALDGAAYAAGAPARVAHFVYLSVAHPAPVMKAYWEARAEGEALLVATGLPATIFRPWYVLGPSHRWPYALLPLYALAERIPATRDGARRLGLVTLTQMTRALAAAVESPPEGVRVLDVPAIRAA